MGTRALADLRGQRVAMIFQEPATPSIRSSRSATRSPRPCAAIPASGDAEPGRGRSELLEMVRIPSPAQRLKAYPHEMSGGMRQRAMIALALSCNPEPAAGRRADDGARRDRADPGSAADPASCSASSTSGVIFVTHDIGVAVEVSDRIGVMYAGKIVELAPVEQMVDAPRHPYSRGLLASTVHDGMRGQRLEAIPGAPPDLAEVPTGCSFAPRCKFVSTDCTARRARSCATSAAATSVQLRAGA